MDTATGPPATADGHNGDTVLVQTCHWMLLDAMEEFPCLLPQRALRVYHGAQLETNPAKVIAIALC